MGKSYPGHITRRRLIAGMIGGAAGGVPLLREASAAAMDKYPSRPLTILCPYQPGGIVDVTSRRLAERLNQLWNDPVVVVNQPGAGGNLAAGMAIRAEPNGYTLLVTLYEGLVISSAGHMNLGFDPVKDMTPVALVGDVELWFLVPASSPFKTMRQFIDHAKAHPGTINMGSIGVGSAHHLGLLQINAQTGAGLVHVPYKGVSMVTDLMAGTIDAAFSSRLSVAGQVKEGKLRILAVTGKRRSTLYPDIPTFAESGLANVFVPYALGAFVSRKVPAKVVDTLNASIIKVLHEPDIRDRFANEGVVVGDLSPAAFNARVTREYGVISDVIVQNNVKLD